MGISGLIQGLMSDPLSTLLYLLISFLAMCISISFHEWAHAFTAYKLGDPTAKNLGRMTLDPFAHLDLMGAIMFVLFGFGWARPVVVNSRNLKHFRRDDVLISLAGPFMNLLLAFVFTGIFRADRRRLVTADTHISDQHEPPFCGVQPDTYISS